jgi:uncharacterized membrane protein YqhA
MKTLFKLIIGIPVLTTFVIALVFMVVGVYDTVIGVQGLIKGQIHTDTNPALRLFEALDIFLIAILCIIFSIGISQLFFPKPSRIINVIDSITPDWLRVENFTQLKLILWDTALTTLVVMFVGQAYKNVGKYDWELAVIPIAIVLISYSRYLIKKGKNELGSS